MQQRAERWLRLALIGAAATGGLWLTARFLLPWAAPFLLSFAIAALMEPAVRFLVRHGWRRGLAAGLTSLAVLGGLIRGAVALAGWGISAASDFAGQVPALMGELAQRMDRAENRAMEWISAAPPEVADAMALALDNLGRTLYGLPALLSQWALDLVRRVAQQSPDALLFAVTAGIGAYFFSAAFPRVLAFLAAQIPESVKQRMEGLGKDLRGSFGGWLRAQLILMGITFFELLLAFLLLGIPGSLGLAALTAVIDALPVFGTGIVLAPWALYCLLLGSVGRGIGLLVTWAAVSLLRSALEARLLGSQIGLDPLASLMALYVGWRVCGVWGMLAFPILLVTAQQLNNKGVVRLWRKI